MDSERPLPRGIRPRLTPPVADVRRAVREAIAELAETKPDEKPDRSRPDATKPDAAKLSETNVEVARAGGPQHDAALLLVALSGGPDSLALAAATAFEARRAGLRAGAVIVDHRLQPGSADVAARAAQQATGLGLDPVRVVPVQVGGEGGPEASARDARYRALTDTATELGAVAVLLGHTLDDQAETVLLGIARGSGPVSLQGMPASWAVPVAAAAAAPRPSAAAPTEMRFLRPLLGIRRAATRQCCIDSGLEAWDDPHNTDAAFARVRVRERVMPVLESELGPGIAEALVRTAEQLREDAAALDRFADEVAEELAELVEGWEEGGGNGGIALPVAALAANPAALRHRLIRLVANAEFDVSLSRLHTLEVARLVTDWRGQGPLDLPGIRVERVGSRIVFSASAAPPAASDPVGEDAWT